MEKQLNGLLDPRVGVYPTIIRMEAKLRTWAITILTAIIASGVANYFGFGGRH